jgi:hypothetical protein
MIGVGDGIIGTLHIGVWDGTGVGTLGRDLDGDGTHGMETDGDGVLDGTHGTDQDGVGTLGMETDGDGIDITEEM